MLGTIVNFVAILIGGSLGLFIKGGLPKRFMDTIMNGIALCIIYIGISGAIKSDQMLLIVVSIVIGSLIGELVNVDGKLVALGNFIESKSKKSSENVSISQGFVTASLRD